MGKVVAGTGQPLENGIAFRSGNALRGAVIAFYLSNEGVLAS